MSQPPAVPDTEPLPALPKRAAPTAASKAAIQASLSAPPVAIPPGPPAGTRSSGGSGKSLLQSSDRLNASPQLPRANAGHRRNNSNLGVSPNDIIPARSVDDIGPVTITREGSTEPSPRPARVAALEKGESRLEITPRPNGDWSHFEGWYEEATAKDALKDLFLISEGGLKVVTEERYRRTVVTAIPDEIRNIKDETWIPECIRIFSSDWTVVQNPEEDRGRQRLMDQSSRMATAAGAEKRVVFGGSKENLSPVVPQAAQAQVTGSSSDVSALVSATKARRGSSIVSVESSGPPSAGGSEILEDTVFTDKPVPGPSLDGSVLRSRPQVPRAPPRKGVEAMLQAVVPKEIPLSMSFARHAERPFPEKMRTRISVEVKELRFMIGDALLTPEPFFCTLAIYDAFKRRKLSEDFHFDAGLSGDYKLLVVNDQNKVEEEIDPETQATKAIFVVTESHNQIFLVLRINHLMRAEIEKDSIYKAKATRPKDIEKHQKETRELLLQANPPLTAFGWAFLPLFDDVGQVKHAGPVAMRELSALKGVLTDEQLYDEINNPDRKTKTLTGHLALDVRRLGDKDEPPNRFDTVLLPVKPFTQTERDPAAFTREIYDFSNTKEYHLSYVNLLFLYPETLKIKSSAANLMVEARLKAIDDPQAGGLRVWFGRSSATKFHSAVTTCAVYKETKASYADELKLKLGRLTPYHHLFFTFYHASANPKKDKRAVLGYAVVPIYRDGRIVLDERMRLPIASELPNRYLDPSAEANIKWLEGKKELFTFRTRIISSLYTRDENLATFMREKEKIKTVLAMDPAIQYQNFPFLLTRLFDALCVKKEEVAQDAFQAIIQVLKSVDQTSDEKTNHNPLLASYVKYMFINVKGAPVFAYEQICRLYLKLLQSNSPLAGEINGFLLEVMVKSMTLKLHETGELYDDSTRRSRFSIDFVRNLYKLITALFVERRLQNLEALTTFPFFVRDLFYIMDRGIVFNLVHQYIQNAATFDGNFGMTVRHQLVKILCDFEQFVPLNLPVTIALPEAISELLAEHWRTHFLTGLLLTELQSCLPMKKGQRLNGVRLLTPLLKRLDADARYSERTRKSRVMDMFFPFVPLLIERYDFLVNELDAPEKRECLVPFVYIVKNLSRELMSAWWKRETQKRQVNFFLTLKLCLELGSPEYKGSNSELTADLNQVLLQAVADFLQDFAHDLQVEGSPLLDSLFGVLHLLFETNALEAFNLWEMQICQFLLQQFGKPLFVHSTNSYCLNLCSFLLKRCNSPNGVVRAKATALFFVLMKRNFEEAKNMSRVRSQSAVAVSRLVGENELKDSQHFVRSMEAVVTQARAEPKSPLLTNFEKHAEELVDRILKLVTYASKIALNKADHEMTVDMYHRISLSYTDSPDLRVTWLENLSALQAGAGSLEEAAACKLAIAGLVCEYLKWKNPRKVPFDKSALQSVAPNITKDLSIFADASVVQSAGAVFQSDIWSSAGLQRVLEEAGDLFAKAGSFDMCVEVSSLQTLVFKTERQYDLLMQCLQRFTDMTKKLIEANKENRSPTRYYRVMLHGKKFEELDGKEFIYKKPSKDNLSVIQNSLREAFAGRVGGVAENVVVLPNSEVDRTKLDPEKVYLQLASVNPYFDALEWENRSTAFDRNFNTNMFIFETPYTTGPKLQTDDLSKQQKKKTLFTTELAFPYLKNRLEIVAKREVIISPIENAIELIEDRVAKLRTELETNPPRLNSLHQVIQGSVVPMVNAGPLHVCEVFLSRTQGEWPEGHVKTLRKAIEDLTRLCGFSIALSKSIIKPEHIPFQQMVEKHYADMKKKVREYLETKEPVPAPETTPTGE